MEAIQFDPNILTEEEMFDFLKRFYGNDFSKPNSSELQKLTTQNLGIFLKAIIQKGEIVSEQLEHYRQYITLPIQDGIFAAVYRNASYRNMTKPMRLSLLLSLENESLINMITEYMTVQIRDREFVFPQTQDQFEQIRQRFIRILHWLSLLTWNLKAVSPVPIWEFGVMVGYEPDEELREQTYSAKLKSNTLTLADECIHAQSSIVAISKEFKKKHEVLPQKGEIIRSTDGFENMCGAIIPFQQADFFFDGEKLLKLPVNSNFEQIPFDMSFPTFPFGYWYASGITVFRIEIEKFLDDLIANLRGPVFQKSTEYRTYGRWEGERFNLAIVADSIELAVHKLKQSSGRGYLRDDYYFLVTC